MGTVGFTVELQWHSPDQVYAAGLLRDGEPWVLNGALVGMGPTPGAAVDDLAGIGRELVINGENYLTDGPIPRADRQYLYDALDNGRDRSHEMWEAMKAPKGGS